MLPSWNLEAPKGRRNSPHPLMIGKDVVVVVSSFVPETEKPLKVSGLRDLEISFKGKRTILFV